MSNPSLPVLHLYPDENSQVTLVSFSPKRFTLTSNKPIKIGRHWNEESIPNETNGYFSVSSSVSRNHAEVWENDNKIYIKDVGSTYGTFVNDKKLSPLTGHEIKTSDKIQLGKDVEDRHGNAKAHPIIARVRCTIASMQESRHRSASLQPQIDRSGSRRTGTSDSIQARAVHHKQNVYQNVSPMLFPKGGATNDFLPDLSNEVEPLSDHHIAFGGTADIFIGKWRDSEEREVQVIIKKHRLLSVGTSSSALDVAKRRILREVYILKDIRHPNILPLLGYHRKVGPSPALIYPFCSGGNVVEYLKTNDGVNRLGLVSGITRGLNVLHSKHIVHGDLKGVSPLSCWHHGILVRMLVYSNPQENILIKRNGEPCICDFGTSKIMDQHGFTTVQFGTYAFMAPELFPPESRLRSNKDEDEEPFQVRTNRESDVYSYGLVALLVLTGVPPVGPQNKSRITLEIQASLRPKRTRYKAETLTESMWELLESCCQSDPARRPTIAIVEKALSDVEFG